MEVDDRTTDTLRHPIEHLASPGSQVTTDGWSSYKAIGETIREDVTHHVVNHNKTFVNEDGKHTNNAEGMHGVFKRQLRRRFWQMTPRNSHGENLALVVFLENCKISHSPLNPVLAWLSACRAMWNAQGKSVDASSDDAMDTD